MKKSNGFTLIELLGVITLIALLAILVVPSVINAVSRNKVKLSEVTTELIYSATGLYLDANQTTYPKISGSIYCPTLEEISNANFLEKNLTDIETNKEVDLNYVVKSKYNGYKFEHEILSRASDCEENIIGETPSIVITSVVFYPEVATETDRYKVDKIVKGQKYTAEISVKTYNINNGKKLQFEIKKYDEDITWGTGAATVQNNSASFNIEVPSTANVGEYVIAVENDNIKTTTNFKIIKDVETILQGNTPDLLNNSLTPVIYDESISMWRVADLTEAWYDYEKQWWANAVILEDGVTKKTGDPIIVPTKDSTETEVRAMYVWIPRYSYTIKSEDGTNYYGKTLSGLGASTASLETPGAIDIKFIGTNIKETGTAKYTGNTASNWLTHPAFTFGTKELTGIWVGKFETSANTDSTCYTQVSYVDVNCTYDKITPYILPNVKSLRYQNVSNQFSTAQKFKGYLSNSTNVDSHMMKNSEWGAVAYLSQSIYGKYGNSLYTGKNKEIYRNNSSSYYTGRSVGTSDAKKVSSQTGSCIYDVINDQGSGKGACGAGASTTGNIYGIYDMSGGSYEYVMGYNNGNRSTDDSGFSDLPAAKYIDIYTATDCGLFTNIHKACNGGVCYGHALSEIDDWYDDSVSGSLCSSVWLIRGSVNDTQYGSDTVKSVGIFSMMSLSGDYSYYSFRTVLVSER